MTRIFLGGYISNHGTVQQCYRWKKNIVISIFFGGGGDHVQQ